MKISTKPVKINVFRFFPMPSFWETISGGVDCSSFTDQTSCEEHDGCTWDGTSCISS